MAFHSLDFFIFFAVTVVLYYLLPQKLQNPLLLISSYVFYAAYDIKLTLLLIVMTVVVYLITLYIDKCRMDENIHAHVKQWMSVGVIICLLPLVFYKYINLLCKILPKGIGYGQKPHLDLLVPLGISFITFSLVSYVVDVYRGTINAEKDLIKFALFVAFFPKVVQGPIEKAGDILPQFDGKHSFNIVRFREGMLLALYGIFMKMVVADTAGIAVDRIYGRLSEYSGAAVLLATVLFTVQIYCDFAGYSLIAIGTARVLGINLQQNFRQPYFSSSVSEFWRRWHISLNRWLTDYIYIPLGGSRCSRNRRILNVLVTFAISGLWHGAAGGYIIWGLLNGMYVVAEFLFKTRVGEDRSKSSLFERYADNRAVLLFKRAVVFILIMFSWVFFRAQHCNAARDVLKRIFFEFNLSGFWMYAKKKLSAGAGTSLYGLDVAYNIPVLLIGIFVVVVIDIISEKIDIVRRLSSGSRIVRWTVCYIMIFAVILFGVYGYGYNSSDFIYTDF